MTLALFLARHRRIGRLVCRGPVASFLAGRVWDTLEADPTFNEQMRVAKAEMAAGGGVRYRVENDSLVRVES